MNRILARLNDATDLFIGGLNNILNPVVVGYDRPIAHNRGGVAVVIDDACPRDRPPCEGHKVKIIFPNEPIERRA